MMKNKGFVLLETVMTICILSVILITLYASYAFILRQSLSRNTYDLTDSIYEGYYITELINNRYPDRNNFFTDECTVLVSGQYKCDMFHSTNLKILNDVYQVDKIYYINPHAFYSDKNKLDLLDATTIDYIKTVGVSRNKDMFIIKYKKLYGEDGSYEIFHSMVEV